ncbi:Sec-independent protein translocase protein TatB [Erwinia tasmaniensis]|uniref:Sec-independent protein translocase protein TatB n=1 Tax=Erwinia tasmaniensis TaxID=338565 RepID=UPI003A4E5276
MFDIGFSELILVFVIGLVVLGPQRLPVAVRTVVGWIRALRSMASSVQNELAQELKLQELQDSLRKVEEASKNSLTPELKASMEELKQSAESMKRSYLGENEKADDVAHTIHNPLVKNAEAAHEGVTPAEAEHHVSAPAQSPEQAEAAVNAQPLSGAAEQAEAAVNAQPASGAAVQTQAQPEVYVQSASTAGVSAQPAEQGAAPAHSPAPASVEPATTAAVTGDDPHLSSRAPTSTTQPGNKR